MKIVYVINWDNGGSAAGTFPGEYATETEAQTVADQIETENRANDVWDENGFCEVVEKETNT